MSDDRFNRFFIDDVIEVLERHGFQCPTSDELTRIQALGRTVGILATLVNAFEGRTNTVYKLTA